MAEKPADQLKDGPQAVANGPSPVVSAKKQSLSDIFTIVSFALLAAFHRWLTIFKFAAGAALVSDGYFNNIMTMVNVLLKKEYPTQYNSVRCNFSWVLLQQTRGL